MRWWDEPLEYLAEAVRDVGAGAWQMGRGLMVIGLAVLLASPAWGMAYLLLTR